MFNQFTIIFDQQWQTYTVAMILAVIVSFIWMLYQFPAEKRGRVFDVCLSSLFGGIILGRLIHVALNWAFFTDRHDLIWQLHREGGLNWQGAVIGVLLAGFAMAKIRQVPIAPLLRHGVIIVPFFALMTWYACTTSACAYGAEVERMADYPRWMTWIADDIYRLNLPRFATQPIGMTSSLCLLVLSILFYWHAWFKKTAFWIMLLFVSLASFAIGFLRGDYSLIWYGLRAGQILDMVMMAFALIGIVWAQISTPTEDLP